MTLRLVGILAILIGTILTGALAGAQIQTITATHTYVMGDSDSKEQARALCYLTAKRKVLDKTGVFIESSGEVKNFQLTKDQINSYSAAIVSVEVVKEEFAFANGINTLTLTVNASLDIADVKKRLAGIVADKSLQAKVDTQQQQIQQLEQQLQMLNQKLGGLSTGEKEEVRKNRDADLVAYYRMGAERGEAEAQANLGHAYGVGEGVSQDHAQAVAWTRKAAEQGHAMGQSYLGYLYVHGNGVPQDYAQAIAWMRKAAEQGESGAQRNLGAMYENGMGVQKDYVKAHKWFNLAAARGEADATKHRNELAQKMSSEQLTKAQHLAREWTEAFEKKQRLRQKTAMKALSKLYPDWEEIVGPKGSTTEYRKWLAEQPTDYQAMIETSWDQEVVGESIGRFKAETARKVKAK